MNPQKLDGVQVWKELEDDLAPRLKLNVNDRAVYAHLLRHTRLEGKVRLRFSIPWLASNVRLSDGPVRDSMRRLADHGALRHIERSNLGHLVEVRLPAEVPALRRQRGTSGRSKLPSAANFEQADFLRTRALRQAIHAREGGRCFYCRRRTPGRSHCLDYVVPRAKSGQNSYRNLVSCCLECNSQKRDLPAGDFLRELYREGRLSRQELTERLHALQALAAGKLRPHVSSGEDEGKAGSFGEPGSSAGLTCVRGR